MNDPKIFQVAVIGGGSAGVMAALRTVLNNDETILFPGTAKDRKKSRAFWVSKIENIPGYQGYKKGIVEPNQETIDWIQNSNLKDKFHLMKNRGITFIKKEKDRFHLMDDQGEVYHASYVILATGVMDIQPEINGDIQAILPFANVQLADYCVRCDGHHVLGKHTGVIGHDTGAAWVAIMLYERYQTPSMTIYTNGNKTEFDETVTGLMKKYSISIVDKKIVNVLGNHKKNHLEGLELEDGELGKMDICFVSLGMIVYNELAKQLHVELDKRGFVVTGPKGQTNVDGLYAVGDLQARKKKQIYTGWDTAVDAADDINHEIRKKRR